MSVFDITYNLLLDELHHLLNHISNAIINFMKLAFIHESRSCHKKIPIIKCNLIHILKSKTNKIFWDKYLICSSTYRGLWNRINKKGIAFQPDATHLSLMTYFNDLTSKVPLHQEAQVVSTLYSFRYNQIWFTKHYAIHPKNYQNMLSKWKELNERFHLTQTGLF